MSRSPDQGALYVVATPIGHLDDLSPRARETLSRVDVIAAEDTRHTAGLLAKIGVQRRLLSLHEHNESRRAALLIEELRQGRSIALVSDAGTPLISDPGFDVVREAIANGIQIIPIPGPCAAIAALSVAGLPTDRFVFEGFLPAKSAKRREHLQQLRHEARTLVFYEAPHRCKESLHDLAEVLGPARPAAIARELTKAFETLYHGSLSELAQLAIEDANLNRGELVIVVAGDSELPVGQPIGLRAEDILRVLLDELSVAQSAKLASKLSGVNRAELYELALKWKKDT